MEPLEALILSGWAFVNRIPTLSKLMETDLPALDSPHPRPDTCGCREAPGGAASSGMCVLSQHKGPAPGSFLTLAVGVPRMWLCGAGVMWGQICPATWVMTAGVKEAPPLWGWSLYPGNVQAGGLTTSLTPVNAQPYGKEAMDRNWLLKLQCIWNVHHDLIYVHIVKESTVDWTDASITSHSRCHHL